MEISIEAIDTMRCLEGDAEPEQPTVTVVDRDADHRAGALKISVRLAANQIVGVLGRKKQSRPVGS